MCGTAHWRWLAVIALGVSGIFFSSSALASSDDPPPSPQGESLERPAHLVVVRIPSRLLTGLLNRRVDHEIAVSDVVLNTPLTGRARLTGHVRLELAPSPDEARFAVVFEGKACSETTGRTGPAKVHGHATTHFKATKEVVFEPGKGFRALPSKVTAETECGADAPDAGDRAGVTGVLSRVTQRRVENRIAEHKAEITDHTRQQTIEKVTAALDEHLGRRLESLNRAVDVRKNVARLRDREGEPRMVCRTTRQYLELASAGTSADAPIELPVYTAARGGNAPVEIWVHQSIIPPRLARAVDRLFNRPEESLILQGLALIPGRASGDAITAVLAAIDSETFDVDRAGDWTLVKVNIEKERTLVAEAPSVLR